jgi:hypothetical protein
MQHDPESPSEPGHTIRHDVRSHRAPIRDQLMSESAPNHLELTAVTQLMAQGQWQAAVDAARPLAERGDLPGILAYCFAANQLGQPFEQLQPFVDQALVHGVIFPAMWVGSRMVSDPSQYDALLPLVNHILDVFPGWDVTAWAQTMAAQGRADAAARLLETVAHPRPQTLRALEAIKSESETVLATLRTAAATVEEDRSKAAKAIQEHADAVSQERERAQKLVTDTTRLVHDAAADHMAQSYAARAQSTLSAALGWTIAALVVATVAVGWGVYVGIHAASGAATTQTVVGKALVTVPLLALAAYLGNVAASTRRMGWHWRHVELQIKTAEPFIAELDDDTRKALQAALAIRFFPGQGQDPQHEGAQSETVDLSSVIAEVFRELRGGVRPPANP